MRQINQTSCGAACIEILFKSHKINCETQQEIFDKVSCESFMMIKVCKNQLMVKYFLDKGYSACCISVKHLKRVLKTCNKYHIDVILHINVRSHFMDSAHFVVLKKVNHRGVIVDDPSKDCAEFFIKFKKLKKMMNFSEFSGVPKKNTLILTNLNKNNLPEFTISCDQNAQIRIFYAVKKYAKEFLCCEHDHWFLNTT